MYAFEKKRRKEELGSKWAAIIPQVGFISFMLDLANYFTGLLHLIWAPLVFILGYLCNNEMTQLCKTKINNLIFACRKPRSANTSQNTLCVFKKNGGGTQFVKHFEITLSKRAIWLLAAVLTNPMKSRDSALTINGDRLPLASLLSSQQLHRLDPSGRPARTSTAMRPSLAVVLPSPC